MALIKYPLQNLLLQIFNGEKPCKMITMSEILTSSSANPFTSGSSFYWTCSFSSCLLFQNGGSRWEILECHTSGSARVFAIPQKHTSLILPYRWLEDVWGVCNGGSWEMLEETQHGRLSYQRFQVFSVRISVNFKQLTQSCRYSMTNLCYRGDDGVTRHMLEHEVLLWISQAFSLCHRLWYPLLCSIQDDAKRFFSFSFLSSLNEAPLSLPDSLCASSSWASEHNKWLNTHGPYGPCASALGHVLILPHL